jgi:predicted O-linked N-acetylglucosamine transferase (SPINDLY family)
MTDVNALLQAGFAHRQRGEHERAVEIYREATQLPDAPGEAFFNLGNALRSLGRWAEAIEAFTACLTRKPDLHGAHLQLARCEVARGELTNAREHFAAILRAEPENFSAWLEAGNLARQQAIPAQALAAYSKATEVAPTRWEGHFALARALEEAGRPEEGAGAYHRAVTAAGHADGEQRRSRTPPASNGHAAPPEGKPVNRVRSVHWAMAKARLERGDVGRALEALRQALMAARIEAMLDQPIEPNEMAEMQIDLGEILIRLGLVDEAHRAFERASAATEEATLVRLAETSFRFNLWQEAQEVLRRNVELRPDNATAHWNLAHSYAESWQLEDALASLSRAEALAPQPGARSMRASVAGRMGDADAALRLYRELAEEEGPLSKMRSSAAMSALYSDTLSAEEVAVLHRELFAPLGQGARAASSFRNTRDAARPLRIGMVTADFHHQHPVNIFMQPVLARLDRAEFEVTVYFVGVSHDEQTRLARSRVAHWVEASKWSDTQLARRIEKDKIDVLLDLAGHTSNNRMSLFGQRAAPVQATFLGYPYSTGVPNIDWIMADGVVAPPEHAGLYSERVAQLPGTVFCFAPETDYPMPELGPEALARPLTFGSFNNVPKLTPRTVRLWSRVLQAVPDSRLLLKAPSFKDAKACEAFAARFAAEGIGRERLEFRGPVGLTDMMAEYGDMDIGLDPVPYNGGTTTLQAMWMGVPVVVREGSHFVSRMGASFMSAAGLEDWIAADDDAYVAIAARMAADRTALLDLKRNLRTQLLSRPAWDADLYARNFGAALREMWRDFCDRTPA